MVDFAVKVMGRPGPTAGLSEASDTPSQLTLTVSDVTGTSPGDGILEVGCVM